MIESIWGFKKITLEKSIWGLDRSEFDLGRFANRPCQYSVKLHKCNLG